MLYEIKNSNGTFVKIILYEVINGKKYGLLIRDTGKTITYIIAKDYTIDGMSIDWKSGEYSEIIKIQDICKPNSTNKEHLKIYYSFTGLYYLELASLIK